jgi:hypothetical protein
LGATKKNPLTNGSNGRTAGLFYRNLPFTLHRARVKM